MSERAFLLLKTGDSRLESSKQTEIRLAILLKILHIQPVSEAEALVREAMDMRWLYLQRFPLDMANWGDFAVLLCGSQYWPGNGRTILLGGAGKSSAKYRYLNEYVGLHKAV